MGADLLSVERVRATITFGNFSFTMGTCTYQLNGGSSTNCNNDDLEMSVTTTANSVTLTYVNSVSPGIALLSQATANGCTCIQYELHRDQHQRAE